MKISDRKFQKPFLNKEIKVEDLKKEYAKFIQRMEAKRDAATEKS